MSDEAFRRNGPGLLAVFVVALAASAGFLFVLYPSASTGLGYSIDGYQEIALQLIRGHGFAVDATSGPTAGRPPLYPMFLAMLYSMFGTGAVAVMWAHAILGALTCSLLVLLGCRMFDRAVGVVAGLMFAVYPPHLWWSAIIMPETLLVFLVVAACLGLVVLIQTPSQRRAVVAGALLGATALCNSVILLFPPVLLLVVAASGRLRRAYLRYAPALFAAMWVVILPWMVRNEAIFHRPIPVNWGAGWNYTKGQVMVEMHMDRPREPMWTPDQASSDEMIRILRANGFGRGDAGHGLEVLKSKGIPGLAEEESLQRMAFEWVRSNPQRALKKFAVNLGLYWYFSRHMLVYKLLNFPLCGLALLGIALGAWRRVETRALLLLSAYFYLTYAAILACARYSLQIMPLLILWVAAAFVALARRQRGQMTLPARPLAATVVPARSRVPGANDPAGRPS